MKASIISNPTAGNPERVASTQPRVGAAAPTLGSRTSGSNPVRVEANQTAAGTAAATSEVEAGNGVARTTLPSAGPFPSATWERGETSGGPDNLLSGWPQATGGSPRTLATENFPVTSRSLREPGQHTHAWRCRAT